MSSCVLQVYQDGWLFRSSSPRLHCWEPRQATGPAEQCSSLIRRSCGEVQTRHLPLHVYPQQQLHQQEPERDHHCIIEAALSILVHHWLYWRHVTVCFAMFTLSTAHIEKKKTDLLPIGNICWINWNIFQKEDSSQNQRFSDTDEGRMYKYK